jgi:uncharacterized SAM-binding protein YcdF (DUF218 family)
MDAAAFLAKKLVSTFCYPLGLSLLFLFGGVWLWRRKPKSRSGFFVILVGLTLLMVMSFPITGFLLTVPLEKRAGAYVNPSDLAKKGVLYIVVLGAGPVIGGTPPAESWGGALLRLMEAVRLWRQIPKAQLVLSGGGYPGKDSEAEAMAQLPIELGVPKKSLVLDTRAWDTMDEAVRLARVVGNKPFALVTSAVHMRRSMELFRSLGTDPIPCPCGFVTKVWPPWYRWFLPTADGLGISSTAFHEYLGGVWLTIRKTVGRHSESQKK